MISPDEERVDPDRAVSPERSLAAAIVVQLVLYLTSGPPHIRLDARLALAAEPFRFWCGIVGCEVQDIERCIGALVEQDGRRRRAPYRCPR